MDFLRKKITRKIKFALFLSVEKWLWNIYRTEKQPKLTK